MPDFQPDADRPAFTEAWTAEASLDTHVRDVAYAEIDSRPVAVAVAGPRVAVWDLESRERLALWADPDPRPNAGTAAPANLLRVAVTDCAGDAVAVTSDVSGHIQMWDLRSGEPLRKSPARSGNRVFALAAMRGPGAGLALVGRASRATSSVYSTPDPDGRVEVWDVATRGLLRLLHHNRYTEAIAVGEHDGRALAVASATYSVNPLIDPGDAESQIFAWDLVTGEPVGETLEPALRYDSIGPVAVGSADGRAVVVGESGGGLRVWELGEVRPVRQIPGTGEIRRLEWGSFGGRPVVLAGGGALLPDGPGWLRAWDPRDWRLLGAVDPGRGSVDSFASTPDGQVILPWGRSVKVLRYAGGF